MAGDGSMRAVLDYCHGLPLVRFAQHEVLIAEGPATGRMFILATGAIEVLRGQTMVAEVAEPGAIFGEISALLGGDHSATVRAASEVTAYRIDDATAFMRNGNEIVFHVAKILAGRLRDATTYLADFKRQFAGRTDHFGLVDEVLEALVQRQSPSVTTGSTRTSDPRL
ncbi:MAG: cyclic nucleotide-binding domain-containing protein [Devosia sp.]|jgi:CRP/FNR family cyclic AMP-dependent transcriptional regulator